MGSSLNASRIRRKSALQNEKVSHTEPQFLHEDRGHKWVLQVTFIERNEKTTSQFKVKRYPKQLGVANPEVDKVMQFPEPVARQLATAIRKQLAIKETDGSGDYWVIPATTEDDEFSNFKQIAPGLFRAMGNRKIRDWLIDQDAEHLLTDALSSAIRLRELKNALEQLRTNLETGIAEEAVYQQWCETHTWAFGNYYVSRDLDRRLGGADIADMLIQPITGFRDIIELKRPDATVIQRDKERKHYYFGTEVSKAIGQCHRYLEVLSKAAGSGMIENKKILACHPRAIIVIGRSNRWEIEDINLPNGDAKERLAALHGLNQRLHGITVMTYDQLLAQGELALALLTAHEAAGTHNAEHTVPAIIP